MSNLKFYKSSEIYAETFYQLPKVFFTNPKYQKLSSDAKIAFALLKERFNYSIKNNWCDNQNRIYFIYTVKELTQILNCGTEKVTKIKKELEHAELLFQKRVGVNQPNRLYLLKPEANATDVYLQANQASIIDNSGFSKIETPKNTTLPVDNSGFSKIETPKNTTLPVDNSGFSKIENNKDIYYINQDTKKEDTKREDTKKQQISNSSDENFQLDKSKLQEQELLNHFAETHQEYSFLNYENLSLIQLFSDSLLDAEKMIGIILRAKKSTEKKFNRVLITDNSYVHDDLLDIQGNIGRTLRRIYQKQKTDSKIENIDNYTFGSFTALFTKLLNELMNINTESSSVEHN